VLVGQNPDTPTQDRTFRTWDFAFASNSTVKAYTGFESATDANEEFFACGGNELFSELRFGVAVHDSGVIADAGAAVLQSRLFHGDVVARVVAEAKKKAEESKQPRQRHGSPPVPALNLFLLPFVVVNSGMTMAQIAALPFYCADKSELGKWLHNVLQVMLPVWERRWCPARNLSWLKENCSNAAGRITLFVDGVDFEFEKFLSFYLQRLLWGVKSKHLAHPAVRSLVCTNEQMDLVFVTQPAGAVASEVCILLLDGFFRRINDEAAKMGEVVDMEVVVDRGYYDWTQFDSFSNLRVTKLTPDHLVAPENKEAKKARKARREKRQKRVFFSGKEALASKVIQRRRQVNERGNRLLRKGRFYSRRISLKWLSKIGRFVKLSHGFANMQNTKRIGKKK